MTVANERFLVNEAGERIAVLIDLVEYERLLEALEELESIRAYDSAKANQDDEPIPFDQAVEEIEQDLR